MMLTPNFDEREFFIHETPPDNIRRDKLPRVARLCQWLRDLAGTPGFVQSYWRSPERNASVGGVDNSQHILGEAADVSFPFTSLRELARRAIAAIHTEPSGAPEFGQLIFYVDTGHVHISVPGATKRGELLVGTKTGGVRRYVAFRSLAQLPAIAKGVATGALILATVAASIFFFPTLA